MDSRLGCGSAGRGLSWHHEPLGFGSCAAARMWPRDWEAQAGGSRAQDHSWLYREFKTSLGYMTPCHETKQTPPTSFSFLLFYFSPPPNFLMSLFGKSSWWKALWCVLRFVFLFVWFLFWFILQGEGDRPGLSLAGIAHKILLETEKIKECFLPGHSTAAIQSHHLLRKPSPVPPFQPEKL